MSTGNEDIITIVRDYDPMELDKLKLHIRVFPPSKHCPDGSIFGVCFDTRKAYLIKNWKYDLAVGAGNVGQNT